MEILNTSRSLPDCDSFIFDKWIGDLDKVEITESRSEVEILRIRISHSSVVGASIWKVKGSTPCGVNPENSLDDENGETKANNNTETNNNRIHIPLPTISQHSTANYNS